MTDCKWSLVKYLFYVKLRAVYLVGLQISKSKQVINYFQVAKLKWRNLEMATHGTD